MPLINFDLRADMARLAGRLLDPDAFVISSTMLKTHDTVVASLSVKNMVLGAPLCSPPGETPRWSDKRKYYGGIHQANYNIFTTAQKTLPYWDVALIDGFEGMEGNGPASGLPVAARLAIASTDFFAADRVALEAMGINPEWVGYLVYGARMGLGQYDLPKIDVIGPAIAEVRKPYRLHPDVERQLRWKEPLTELPPRLGGGFRR
jgi:uncharacterized protein (DUF362 family)